MRGHQRLGDEPEGDRGHHARDDHALVERVHDLAAVAHPHEEGADDGGDDRSGAERERVDDRGAADAGQHQTAEQHGGDEGDRIGLEQVGGHASAVADVVTDVVRDHRGVARVVLRDARLDLADEVGTDIRTLGEDAATEAREDGDQRAAEGETDQGTQRHLVAHDRDHELVVEGDADQPETHDQHAGDRAALEGDLQRGVQAVVGCLGGAHVRAHRDVHADVAGDA